MTSRISLCNGGLLRRSFVKGAPLWSLWLLGWLLILPIYLITRPDVYPFELTQHVNGCLTLGCTIAAFFYGLAVAWYQFSWLYRTRSAYHYASLPLRRETQFLTRYLSGLLFHIGPALVVTLLSMAAGGAQGENVVLPILNWLGATTLLFLFYYSLAVLCALLTGHVAAMPVLYLIANFLSLVLQEVLSLILTLILFGFSAGQNLWPTWFSPLVYCMNHETFSQQRLQNAAGETTGYLFIGWKPALIFGAVGLLFALIAFMLLRQRRMESAGDVIAVGWLKPVFRYGVTLCCGLTLGWIIVSLVLESGRTSFLPLLVCVLIASVIGFFAAEMLLAKSLRVFQKKNLLHLGGALVVITVLLLGCKYDVFGFSRYVPQADQVASVSLDYCPAVDDSTIIERTIALHQEIVDNRHALENTPGNTLSYRITYYLQNGTTVERYYHLPFGDYSDPDPSSLGYRMEVLENDPTVLLEAYFTEQAQPLLEELSVEYRIEDGSYFQFSLTLAQKETLVEAMRTDVSLGLLGKTGILAVEELGSHLSVSWLYLSPDSVPGRYTSLSITAESVNTLKALRDMGLPEDALQ